MENKTRIIPEDGLKGKISVRTEIRNIQCLQKMHLGVNCIVLTLYLLFKSHRITKDFSAMTKALLRAGGKSSARLSEVRG